MQYAHATTMEQNESTHWLGLVLFIVFAIGPALWL